MPLGTLLLKLSHGSAWLGQLMAHVTLDIGVVSLSPALGVESTEKITLEFVEFKGVFSM